MRNMRYTQQLEEMQNRRKARKLTTQEIIALVLVIAAFAYIIFGLVNRDDADYYELEYAAPASESPDNTGSSSSEFADELDANYEVYYETP